MGHNCVLLYVSALLKYPLGFCSVFCLKGNLADRRGGGGIDKRGWGEVVRGSRMSSSCLNRQCVLGQVT